MKNITVVLFLLLVTSLFCKVLNLKCYACDDSKKPWKAEKRCKHLMNITSEDCDNAIQDPVCVSFQYLGGELTRGCDDYIKLKDALSIFKMDIEPFRCEARLPYVEGCWCNTGLCNVVEYITPTPVVKQNGSERAEIDSVCLIILVLLFS